MRTPVRILFFLCLAGGAAAQQYTPAARQYTPFEDALARFDAQIAAQVQVDGLGAISAGVVVGDELVWKRAWGWADVSRQIPADPDGVYRIGSLTKVFTGVLLMHLVERGIFGLDDAVDPYVPELDQLPNRPVNTTITFRQLASHAAGMAAFPDVPDPFRKVDDDGWDTLLLEFIPKAPVLGPPGETVQYSNIMGYGILGLAMQRAAGRSFIQMMDEVIFQPLGLEHTGYPRITPAMQARLATGYQNYRDGRMDSERVRRHQNKLGADVPSSSLYSTVDDLARLMELLMTMPGTGASSILSSASLREIRTVQAATGRQRRGYVDRGYGLGVLIMEHPSGLVYIVQSGYDSGYRSILCFDPQSEIGVIMLRNYNEGATFLPIAAADLLVELVAASG